MISHKYLILGAGPAGLQMAYFLQKAGLDYLILEKNDVPGKFYEKYPIHRKLISINKKNNYFTEKEFNLRHDWNSLLMEENELSFTTYSDELFPDASDLFRYLQDFTKQNDLNIQYNTQVNNISKNDSINFVVTTNSETYESKVLLIGTGVAKQNKPKDIEGVEYCTDYTSLSADTDQFLNKRVAILGGGNSAFETANSLAASAAFVHVFLRSPLKMAYETHFVGNLRAKYTNLFDMYQLKSLHAILKPRIRKITKLPNGNLQTQHEYDYPDSSVKGTLKLTREYDYILNCTGFKYTNLPLFDGGIIPETVEDEKFYKLNEQWESSNVQNLFFIGTHMQAIDRKAASGFIHGFRYNIRTLSHMIQERYESKPYPSLLFDLNHFEVILKELYKRVSIGDGIFQLYGFLGDVLEYHPTEKQLEWKKELPLAYTIKNILPAQHVLTLSLEFGFDKYPNRSSMSFMGPSDPHETEKSAFLHPIVRYYHKGDQKEFHFGDSLLGRWDMPHSSGGAIATYHTEFYNWLASIFELPTIDTSSLGENPNFEKW
jgi:thioredoxin reductase